MYVIVGYADSLNIKLQIMWSTFVPLVPNSILPGASAFVIAVAAVIMVSFLALWLQFSFLPFIFSLSSVHVFQSYQSLKPLGYFF